MKDNMKDKKENKYPKNSEEAFKVIKIIGFVILGIVVAVGLGFVIMWLWNWLMPMIFGLTTLTYWQGLGLLALTSLLFGRLGGGGSSDSKKEDKCKDDDRGRRRGHIRGRDGGDGRGPGRVIKDEIKAEIMKELDKEFDTEPEDNEKEEKANNDYEALYEKWWTEEGEKTFEKYMSDGNDDA